MRKSQRISLTLLTILLLSLTACDIFTKQKTFQGDGFSFTIPKGWKTMAEVWNQEPVTGQDYYGLGLAEQVMIQYPAQQRKGRAFFSVATARLAGGEDLESRFTRTYEGLTPEIKDPTRASFQQGDFAGYEITYSRPWGEPWWQFRDIWLEKDGMIYMLSAHASPQSFADYTDTFDQIISSFEITQGK
jgi:hypothetical protein